MRSARFLAVVAVLAMAVVARAEVTSGPQVGDRVGAFTVTKVAGNPGDGITDGQHLCYRCKTGAKPVVMVFARTADEKLAKLLKKVEEEVAEHEDKKMLSFVNMIGSDAESLKKAAADFVAKHDLKRIAFVVPDDAKDGPPDFKIAPDADVTVICYREGKVQANHAFPKGGLTDDTIDAVVKASCALVE
ncbi:MAG: hypothetical protein ACKOZU_02525 [Planctomycetaceae bacterium]